MRTIAGVVLLMALLCAMLLVNPVYAQNQTPPSDLGTVINGSPANGEPTTVAYKTKTDGTVESQIIQCSAYPEAKGGVLLGKIIPCMVRTIEKATQSFSAAFINYLRPIFYAFLTLVVVLFGVRMLQNEPEMHKHGLLLLLKITLVLAVLDNIPGYFVPASYDIMNEAVSIVTGAIDTTSFNCEISKYGDSNTPKLWSILDCVLGKIFGFTLGTDGGRNMLLSASLLGLASGFFFGGAWGAIVAFGIIGTIVSMFMLVVRVVMAFLNGYLTISILFIISPLLLPLTFLRITQSYFDKVWRNILAAFILPVVVTAYSMLALQLYDKIMLDPKDSLLTVLFDRTKIDEALKGTKKIGGQEVTGEPVAQFGQEITALKFDANAITKWFSNNVMPTLSGSNAAGLNAPDFDPTLINDPRFKKGKETMEAIFITLVQLLLVAYLINAGQEAVTGTLIRQLTGAGAAIAPFSATTPEEFKFKQAFDNFRQNTQSRLNESKSGSDFSGGAYFLGRAPGIIGDSLKQFVQDIRK